MELYLNAVEGQLNAYNDKNLDGFLKWYANDIIGIDAESEKILFRGKKAMGEIYSKLFENKLLNCKLMNRMISNNVIIDHERIFRDISDNYSEAIAIYNVNDDGLIEKVRFIKTVNNS